MSRRVCAVIGRGMTDKTAVWVFPWELAILQLVHNDSVEQKTIDELCDLKKPLKVEKQKLKHSEVAPPDLRQQFEIFEYVDPDEDPAKDPASEFDRMVAKYGMDKEFPMPCVERVYGQFSSGNFERMLKEKAEDRAEKPNYLKAIDEGMSRSPLDMTVGELRKELSARSIKWAVRDGQEQLAAKLEAALAPA